MAAFCTSPEVRERFAQKVFDLLTPEQKEELGITDDNSEDAKVVIAAIAKPWINNVETVEEQQDKEEHPEKFLPILREGMTVSLDDEDFEKAEKEMAFFNENSKAKDGFSYLVHAESDNKDDMDNWKKRFLGLHGTIAETIWDWEDKDGNSHSAIIIRKPVRLSALSPQDKALKALEKLAALGENANVVAIEIKNNITGTKKRWNKKRPVPQGWSKTGRFYRKYNGVEIVTNSVSNEVHGFKDDYTETIATKLGKILDNFSRQFFDSTSNLWKIKNLKELVDKEKLTEEDREIFRDYINTELQGIYTVDGLRNLIRDFLELERQINTRWPGAKMFSKKLQMVAQKTGEDGYVLGEPDLIVVDKEGILHPMDFKTWRIGSGKDYRTLYKRENSDYDRQKDYGEQESNYIRILQAQGFRTEECPYIVQIDTYYAAMDDFTLSDRNVRVRVSDDENEGLQTLGEYIENEGLEGDETVRSEIIQRLNGNRPEGRIILYIEPRLHLGTRPDGGMSDELAAIRGKEDLEFNGNISFEKQFDSMDAVLQAAFKDFAGQVVHRGMAQGVVKFPEDDIDSRPDIISQDEMQTIIDGIMYTASEYITKLIRGDESVERMLQEDFPDLGTSLRGKSRKEVIKTLGIANLVMCIAKKRLFKDYRQFPILTKEQYEKEADEDGYWEDDQIDFESWKDYERRKKHNDKVAWLMDHYNQLVMKGQPKLKALEGVTCPIVLEEGKLEQTTPNIGTDTDPEDMSDDNGDNDAINSFVDRYLEGISNLEAWMMGQKNYSPKASLAKEIKRIFEDIILVDEDGEEMTDKYHWGFPQHLDSTKAVQACLDICKDCETIEEMEEAMEAAALIPQNRWIDQVLNIIREKGNENIRTKFFRHMRKDAFYYSVGQFKVVNGQRVVVTKIVNVKSAAQTMTQSLNASFFNGTVGEFIYDADRNPVPLISKGRISPAKTTNVADLIFEEARKLKDTYDNIYSSHSRYRKEHRDDPLSLGQYITKKLEEGDFIKRLTNVLHGIGILVTEDVVKNAALRRPEQIVSGNLTVMLDNAMEATKKLREMDGKGGIPKGIAGNSAFMFYKPIIDVLGEYVQSHVEACTYQDGKTYFTYSNPSRLDHLVRNLKDARRQYNPNKDTDKFREFMYDRFGRYKGWFTSNEDGSYMLDWLAQLNNFQTKGPMNARKALKHKVELSFTGDQYRDLGPLNFMRSLLHNYFGSREDEIEGKGLYRWFGLPTMSNKPTNEFIRMIKYKNHDEIIERVLKPTFNQEMNRIADVLMHYASNATPTDQIDLVDINGKDKVEAALRDRLEARHPQWKKEQLDKAVEEEIKAFKGYDEKVTEVGKDGKEHTVIVHHTGRIEDGNITLRDLKMLLSLNSGAKFHFLWYLNNDILNDQDSTLDDSTTIGERIVNRINLLLSSSDSEQQINKDVNYETDTDTAVTNLIRINMEGLRDEEGNIIRKGLVDIEMDHMEEIGLLSKETKRIMGHEVEVLKYQGEFGGKLGKLKTDEVGDKFKTVQEAAEDAEKQFKEGLIDYIWQDIAANINIIQITGGDLAFYGNSINYQKRIAMIHSPGVHLMHNEQVDDGYLRSVHISDELILSDIKENAIVALNDYKDSLSSEAQKREYEMMINIIASGFNNLNTTDGQSYSCLSSDRKKLTLMGEWTEEDEEAYQKILNGDLSMETLGTMIKPKKPKKPFVASDMAKYSGSTTMTLRKVPLQDKNSEYLIILAEALARQSGKRSKLVAISDFMETTHREGDGKHGIDTAHFGSVGKVGVSGVIDINWFDRHYDDIYAKAVQDRNKEVIDNKRVLYKEEAYNALLTSYLLKCVKRKEKSDIDPSIEENYIKQQDLTQADDNGRKALKEEELYYDPDYVDTIPVEDYIQQQEVPAHLLDEKDQLYGSQIRILGISDITPGTEFDVNGEKLTDKQLVQEYKELHADNITASFDALMKELGLDMLVDENGQRVTVDNAPQDVKDKIYTNLATLLQKELVMDGKYSVDIQKACRLIRNASGVQGFAVPLMDPIQSKRVQMLLNSIIKKRINKQGISGGPVVQATAYDNRLHIRFKDEQGNILMSFDEFLKEHSELDGKKNRDKAVAEFRKYLEDKQAGIAYYECYMPIPNPALEKLMTNPDGTIMTIKEIQEKLPKEVWKSLSEAIGYRIPTEDKYSMLPLKIMGFVPKAAGEVIMMPQEITYLTGSDFDIDKMYIMLKSFETASLSIDKTDSTKVTITKGNEQITIDINGFTGDMGDSELRKEARKQMARAEATNNLEEKSKALNAAENAVIRANEAREDFMNAVQKLVRNADRILSGDYSRTLLSGMSKKEKDIVTYRIVKMGVPQDNFLNWFRDQLLQNSFIEYTDRNSELPDAAREARNNRILDLQWAVLTNKDTVSKMLNPGNFEPQKKVGRMIRIIKEGLAPQTMEEWNRMEGMQSKQLDKILDKGDPHSVTLPSSKIYFQKQNMQGTQMVGIFANNNVSHAFMTFHKVGIRLTRHGHDTSFYFDGIHLGDNDNPTVLDPQKGRNGQLISKTIASFLAAAVDTAKDPTLADMNINTFTGGVAMTLARMGFDTQEIGLFLSQPIIMELTDLYFKNKSSETYYTGKNAVEELRTKMGLRREDMWDMSEIKHPDTLTKETLIRHLTDSDFIEEGNTDKDSREFQIAVLKAFDTLLDAARDMQDLTFCTKFNSVSNAVGPTIADTEEDRQKVDRFMGKLQETIFYVPSDNPVENPEGYTNPNEILTYDPEHPEKGDAILNAFYASTLGNSGASRRIFENFFPHYSAGFQNVLDFFKENYLKSGKIDNKLYNKLLDDYLYYCLTYKSDTIRPVLPYDNELHGEEQGDLDYLVKGIVDRFKDIMSLEEKRSIPNMLLDQHLGNNCLRIREKDEYLTQEVLVFNSSQMNTETEDVVRRAWDAVLQMNDPNLTEKENEKIRRFGVDLFFYSLMRNGFGFSPRTLMHLATVIVRYSAKFGNDFANYMEGIQRIPVISNILTGSRLGGMGSDYAHLSKFCDMFVRNHSNNKNIVPFVERDSTVVEDSMSKDDTLVLSVPAKEAYRLNSFMLNEKEPLKFVNLVTRSSEGMKYELYELDRNNVVSKEGSGFKTIRYKKTTRLGITNQFIEYNANDRIEKSYYDSIRGTSDAGFEDEETEEDDNKVAQPDEEVYNTSDEEVVITFKAVKKAIKKIDNEVENEFMTKLKNIFDSGERSIIREELDTIINRDASEQERKDAWERVKSVKDQIDDVIKPQNKC